MPRRISRKLRSLDKDNLRLPRLITAAGEAAVKTAHSLLSSKWAYSAKTGRSCQLTWENFCTWCARQGLTSITQVTPELVMGWITRSDVEIAEKLIQPGFLRDLFSGLRGAGLVATNPVPNPGSLRQLLRRSAAGEDLVPALIRATGNDTVGSYLSSQESPHFD